VGLCQAFGHRQPACLTPHLNHSATARESGLAEPGPLLLWYAPHRPHRSSTGRQAGSRVVTWATEPGRWGLCHWRVEARPACALRWAHERNGPRPVPPTVHRNWIALDPSFVCTRSYPHSLQTNKKQTI
jgi:hypothetical protein